jgi:molecular chaperone Hsp33
LKNIAVRGISQDKFLRFFAVDCTEALQEAIRMHGLSVVNTIIMGRALAATLMLSLDLKSEQDAITFKIESDGISGGVLITGKADGTVKGYVGNPKAELPTNDNKQSGIIKEALGKGHITIIKDMGMKQPYEGTVELLYGEIAEDLTYYFAKSEQIPTSIGLGVLLDEKGAVKQAGGFMIQLLPDTPVAVIEKLESLVSHFPNLTDLMDMGYALQDILSNILLKDIPIVFLKEKKVSYHCDCSKEKFSKGLKLLEKDELQEAIKKKDNIQVVCHFCNTTYDYDKDDISEILNEM